MTSGTAGISGVGRLVGWLSGFLPWASVATALPPAADDLASASSNDVSTHTLLFAGAVFLVILLVGLGVHAWQERRGAGRAAREAEGGGPEVTRVEEGSVLRYFVPTAPGREPLPGRLDVVRGDSKVKEIRFFSARGQAYPEVTFGRVVGTPLCHVQLVAGDVGGRQAKLSFMDGRWRLSNLARPPKPPTRHRGVAMSLDQQVVLGDGDEVEIGPVTFVFRD